MIDDGHVLLELTNLESAIKNLGILGSLGMSGTDKVILVIMLAKQ